ncbi:hypothetical protein R3P38DRAFT_3354459 [Favolaschia claudopus]|uniref:F-box domain-containing protein n=1 Tax=Favolaschia claudopus TaxID=2862362 RepID=A0AAW0BQL0_9AGAR
MARQTPLNVPEVLDHCISFVPIPSPDLLACSLVARSWVYAAQLRLFRAPHITNIRFPDEEEILWRFHSSLVSSRHLVGLVRELDLGSSLFDYCTTAAFCEVSFTHLECLTLGMPAAKEELSPIQSLFSVASLRRLEISALSFISDFQYVFKHFSPAIQHLDMHFDLSTTTIHPPADTSVPTLISLRLWVEWIREPAPLDPVLSYFNLSELKAISIDASSDVTFPWDKISLDMIQILDISIRSESTTFGDLGRFVNLRFLRIRIDSGGRPSNAVSILQMATRCPVMRTIVVSVFVHQVNNANSEDYAKLDSVLASLPSHIVVELEFEDGEAASDEDDCSIGSALEHQFDFFPQLRVRTSACTAYRAGSQITARWRVRSKILAINQVDFDHRA